MHDFESDELVRPDTLKKLATYDTPTICNVIELFEIRPRNTGYMDGRIRAAFHDLPPAVGYAATASFRSAEQYADSTIYEKLERQLKLMAHLPGPAFIAFQDIDDPAVGATFGEVMCSTYQAFGAVGLVTSGGGRDMEQVRALSFPVFTGTTICSHAYCNIVDIGIPIRLGGLLVHYGDLLHGDANGITSIPLSIASEVADVADEFMAAELNVLDYNKSRDDKSIQDFLEQIKRMGDEISKLTKQVSRSRGGHCDA